MGDDMIADELECARLILRLAYFADSDRSADYTALFAEDGELVGRHVAKGEEAIRAVMDARPKGRHTRHVLTPPLVELSTPDEASAVAYATVYVALEHDRNETGVLPLNSPFLAEFRSTLRRTTQGWRIARHEVSVLFAPAS